MRTRMILAAAVAMIVGGGAATARQNQPDTGAVDSIRDTLAQIVEASVTKDGLDDMVERFVDADRNRLGKDDVKEEDGPLNAAAERLKAAWKAKYNRDFDIQDEAKIYGPYRIELGELKQGVGDNRADTNLQAGRNTATIVVPAEGGKAEMRVPLIREMGGYRFDVPDGLTEPALRAAVTRTLTKLADGSSSWPSDESAAYRAVTRELLSALWSAQ